MKNLPESQKARAELARRELARRRLIEFAKYTFPGYKPEPAHRLLAEHLEAVLRGELKRLIILAPPRHGKSELVSVRFPAWWLGRRPDDPVILASYSASLAHSFSRRVRNLVESPVFGRLFPDVTVSQGSRRVDDWQIDGRRGGLRADGVGGSLTGFGAEVAIIDDPHKNVAELQSAALRELVWEWYRSVVRTRLSETGAMVVVGSRWHHDDLIGRLLVEQGVVEQGGTWLVLRLPALAEDQAERDANNEVLGLPAGLPDPLGRDPGDPLCPGRFSREALGEIRRDLGSFLWSAGYQGVPRPAEGNRFKREWFEVVDAPPAVGERVRFWDLGSTEGGGDPTVGLLMQAHAGSFYVVDVVRGQWGAAQRDDVIKQVAAMDGMDTKIRFEQEPGASGKSLVSYLVRMLAGFAVVGVRSTGSKTVRAEPLAAQAEAGNVYLVRAPWNAEFLEEITNFPSGKHDDQVDAATGAFLALTTEEEEKKEVKAHRMDVLEMMKRNVERSTDTPDPGVLKMQAGKTPLWGFDYSQPPTMLGGKRK